MRPLVHHRVPEKAWEIIRGAFSDFGKLQAALEAQGVAVRSAESEYVTQHLVTLAEDQATEVLKLVDALEQDEDVQRVFHSRCELRHALDDALSEKRV
jgi:transcriptional/translational regulatory protein YebC/TACO1